MWGGGVIHEWRGGEGGARRRARSGAQPASQQRAQLLPPRPAAAAGCSCRPSITPPRSPRPTPHAAARTGHVTLGAVLLAAAVGLVAGGAGAARVGALVDLGVGVAQLDGDVALQLVLEPNRLHARDGLDHRRLAVRHVANRACEGEGFREQRHAWGGEPGGPAGPGCCCSRAGRLPAGGRSRPWQAAAAWLPLPPRRPGRWGGGKTPPCCHPGHPILAGSNAAAQGAGRTDVDGGLAGDDLRRQRRQLGNIQGAQVLWAGGWRQQGPIPAAPPGMCTPCAPHLLPEPLSSLGRHGGCCCRRGRCGGRSPGVHWLGVMKGERPGCTRRRDGEGPMLVDCCHWARMQCFAAAIMLRAARRRATAAPLPLSPCRCWGLSALIPPDRRDRRNPPQFPLVNASSFTCWAAAGPGAWPRPCCC